MKKITAADTFPDFTNYNLTEDHTESSITLSTQHFNNVRDHMSEASANTSIDLHHLSNNCSFNEEEIQTAWSHIAYLTVNAYSTLKIHAFQDKDSYCFNSPDVVCPEESRVQLQNSKEYHANFISITLPDGNNHRMILAQQPVNLGESLQRFSHMIQENNISSIFDLRSAIDFQAKGSLNYNSQINDLKNCQYTPYNQWPDHGVIASEQLRHLRDNLNSALCEKGNVLMHCRAGIGRSGCVAVYTSVYNQLKITQPKNKQELLDCLSKSILEARTQRSPELIQGANQFKLVLNTLAEDFLS